MRGEQYITKPEQYADIYNRGASWVDKVVVVKTLHNGLTLSRYGFSVSSRVGGSVVRNRVKRQLREILRHASLKSGWDIVLIARPAAARVKYAVLETEVVKLLSKAKLMEPAVNTEKTGNIAL